MKMYLRLVSALIQGVEPSDKEKKRNKVFYVVMSIIAGFGIMLPMTFFVGVILYALTGSLRSLELGTTQNGVELFLHLISAFSFVFGLNVIFSVFYFSGDIENLLPLPLKPYQIIGSKFTAALISESIMEFLVIIAALAGYIIGGGLPIYSWLVAVIGMLTLPVLPLVYCGIICMIVMYFTRFVKNKDIVVTVKHLENFCSLLHTDGNIFNHSIRIDLQTIFLGQSNNFFSGFGFLQESGFVGFDPEDDIIQDCKAFDELEMLMNHTDSEIIGIVRVMDLYLLSVFTDLAFFRLI